MLRVPAHVFKDGVEVARDGTLGRAGGATQVVRPDFDGQIEKRMRRVLRRPHERRLSIHFPLREGELADAGDHRARMPVGRGRADVNLDGVAIDDTFAEAFGMSATRLLITADTAALGAHRRRELQLASPPP